MAADVGAPEQPRGGALLGLAGGIGEILNPVLAETLLGLMMAAYGVFADGVTVGTRIPYITGGPGWVRSDP